MRTIFTLLVINFLIQLEPVQAQSQTQQPYSSYHVKLQYAGSIGFMSAGIGRSLFEEKLETDLLLGYLPESIGGDRIWTTALKATFAAVRPMPVKAVDWQPLRFGLQLSYTFGEQYYIVEPRSKYPRGYYGFPTALHLYLYGGGQVDLNRVRKLSRYSVYYEVGTSAEYLVSYIQNPKYLGPGKIFNLALGLRMRI